MSDTRLRFALVVVAGRVFGSTVGLAPVVVAHVPAVVTRAFITVALVFLHRNRLAVGRIHAAFRTEIGVVDGGVGVDIEFLADSLQNDTLFGDLRLQCINPLTRVFDRSLG